MLRITLLVLAVGACDGGGISGPNTAPLPPPNGEPGLTYVQLPDSILLPVGSSAIIVDVMRLFHDDDPLDVDAESSDIDVAVVNVWRQTARPGEPVHPVYDRTTHQISIIAVGEGEAVVTITVTEPEFDPNDSRPVQYRPQGRSASRELRVTVEGAVP